MLSLPQQTKFIPCLQVCKRHSFLLYTSRCVIFQLPPPRQELSLLLTRPSPDQLRDQTPSLPILVPLRSRMSWKSELSSLSLPHHSDCGNNTNGNIIVSALSVPGSALCTLDKSSQVPCCGTPILRLLALLKVSTPFRIGKVSVVPLFLLLT